MSFVLLMTLNKVENLLLSFGQSVHTGHLTSITKPPLSQDIVNLLLTNIRNPRLPPPPFYVTSGLNMRMFLMIALMGLFPFSAKSDIVLTDMNLDARAILDRVLANRLTKDFSLKARLLVGRNDPVPADILIKNTAEETRTIYRAGQTEALVVQPVHGAPHFYVRGRGELTGAQRSERFLGSDFTYYDLGLPFLQWPAAKFLGEERVRGRDCYAIESMADGEPYARARIWIDKEYFALLRSEAFDANGTLLRRFAITSFKRIGAIWITRGLEAASLLPGQSLPSQEKSRLEIYEGNYDAVLPAETFSTNHFAAISH